ncbi:MAG: ATPase, T2SS/T4P/T4SS family [Nitrosomonadaceae bacterium]|nr:ATPase, T2SS/T4P/T4SS family [Nitrosomonadaceae bacterium]
MSTIPAQDSAQANPVDSNVKLNFSENLQAVTNRIRAASNIDEIMLEVSKDICSLFNADRLIVYSIGEDGTFIASKVKTGSNSSRELKIHIEDQDIVGFVSLSKKIVNIKDVYDENELKALSPKLRFLREVDKRTGYRTKQMLVAPILDTGNNELIGVVQIINCGSGKPFPQMTVDGVSELCQILAIAFKQHQKPRQPSKSKYDNLVAEGAISADELDLAARSARRTGHDLEAILIDEFQIKPVSLGKSLSLFFGVEYEPFKADRIWPVKRLKNLKRDYVEKNLWLPIDETKDGLVVLTPDPDKIKALHIVDNVFSKNRIIYKVCSGREFKATLDLFYGDTGLGEANADSIGEMLSTLDNIVEIEAVTEDVSSVSDNDLVKLVNKIIVDAYNMGASDIHVEPYPGNAKTEIRFRMDGSLVPYIQIPAVYRNPLVTRLKIMCDLDISEKRRPQDGKIKFKKFGPLDIELRVVTIPSAGGMEDVVMRILTAGKVIPLDKMGFTAHNLKELKKVISQPYGLFFVCGPTGSGKTTTLHSILQSLNTKETKIWTAEDPVEITQKGLRQVQMNIKAGLTFSVVMKSFLRADPDIIMVGEMRDKETTSLGIEASLTGHLVFATLHTNSATESIIRLLDMGMDPFTFSDALLGVLAQRLAKRLCSCKKAHTAGQEELQALLAEYCGELKNIERFKTDPAAAYQAIQADWIKQYGDGQGQIMLHEPVGCDACNGSGYKGRVGLYELLIATDALKKNIQDHARVTEMLVTALGDGMRTLKQDGIEKVLQGITDMQQVHTVCIK